MATYIADFEQYKDKIPEFIVKLYHILEVNLLIFRVSSTEIIFAGSEIVKY
jgi:hypothetical protein